MNVIKLRGLPWSCTVEDVVKFLTGIKIAPKSSETDTKSPSVYLTSNAEGRPSGEAFVELVDDSDAEAALKRNNAMIGQRYIEVFRSNQEQLSKHIQESWSSTTNWSEPVVRLRGLPFGCHKEDIATFFTGLNIAFDGILMVIDFSGQFNGEAFVRFSNILDANKALERHKQKISNRYIEVFRSSRQEMAHYSCHSQTSMRAKQPTRMNKRNSNWNSGTDVYRQNSGDFNRNRQKPYSRNTSQSVQSRFRGQNQSAPIPSLMENFSGNQQCGYNRSVSLGSKSRRTGFGVRLRGLPYSVNEVQIRDFFKPLIPVNVVLSRGRDGRPSGECEVDFESQNLTNEALKYDKKYIGNRYIEIFALNSGAKVQNSMSIDTLMKQDFGNKNAGSNGNLNNDLNGSGYVPLESGVNPMPVPPPPPLMNHQNSMGSLLGPIPSLNQMGNSNMNELIFADMAKQMTQLYSQFQSQQQFIAGMNMMQANGPNVPSSMNRRF